MDLFGYYVNILAIVFSAMFMFVKIIGGRHRRGDHHGRVGDVESTLLNHASDVPSSGDTHNGILLTAADDVKTDLGKVCATISHIEHADTERPAA